MRQYNSINTKPSNSQPDKSKPAPKTATENAAEVILRLSSNSISNPNDKINFPHKLLRTNRQVSSLPKAYGNNSFADIKLSKHKYRKSSIRQISW